MGVGVFIQLKSSIQAGCSVKVNLNIFELYMNKRKKPMIIGVKRNKQSCDLFLLLINHCCFNIALNYFKNFNLFYS